MYNKFQLIEYISKISDGDPLGSYHLHLLYPPTSGADPGIFSGGVHL